MKTSWASCAANAQYWTWKQYSDIQNKKKIEKKAKRFKKLRKKKHGSPTR